MESTPLELAGKIINAKGDAERDIAHDEGADQVAAAYLEAVIALSEIVDWFDDLQRIQRAGLIEGQTLESAAQNWDAVTTPKALDFTKARIVLGRN